MSEDTTLLTALVSHALPSLDTHMQWTNLHCREEGLLLVLQCNDVSCSRIQQCSCQHSKPWVHFYHQRILQTGQTLRNLLCAQAPARERELCQTKQLYSYPLQAWHMPCADVLCASAHSLDLECTSFLKITCRAPAFLTYTTITFTLTVHITFW